MPVVTVWNQDGSKFISVEEYDYVSFINNETHGIPAMLSGRSAATLEAETGEAVLYVNTSLVPLLEVEK